MIKDLSDNQQKLANYMSGLSELAYSATWMDDLEFALWKAVKGQIKDYGRLEFSSEIIKELKRLSQIINGWIIFDDEYEETFVTWEEWDKLNEVDSNK